jgi:tetratricopeptide (TPR) repeat protein
MESLTTVESLQAAVTQSPFDTKLLFRLASAHHQAKDYASAVRILERILRFEKKSGNVLSLLGDCYYLLDEDEKSCQVLEEALKYPNAPCMLIRLKLGLLYAKHGDFGQAATMLNLVIQRGSEKVEHICKAKLALAKCLEAENDLNRAISTYREVFELAETPIKKALYLAFIARCQAKSQQPIHCLSSLEEAKLLAPDYSKLTKFQGLCQYILGDFLSAKAHLLKSIEIQQESEAEKADLEFMLGCCLVKLGETGEAYTHLTVAVEKQPECAWVWAAFGVAYTCRQQIQEAHHCIVRSLCLDPRNPEALSNLAVVYQMCSQVNLAEMAFRKARELLPQLSPISGLLLPRFELSTETCLLHPLIKPLKPSICPFTININDFPAPLQLSKAPIRTKTPNSSPAPSPSKKPQVSTFSPQLPSVSPNRKQTTCSLPHFRFVESDIQELMGNSECGKKN